MTSAAVPPANCSFNLSWYSLQGVLSRVAFVLVFSSMIGSVIVPESPPPSAETDRCRFGSRVACSSFRGSLFLGRLGGRGRGATGNQGTRAGQSRPLQEITPRDIEVLRRLHEQFSSCVKHGGNERLVYRNIEVRLWCSVLGFHLLSRKSVEKRIKSLAYLLLTANYAIAERF